MTSRCLAITVLVLAVTIAACAPSETRPATQSLPVSPSSPATVTVQAGQNQADLRGVRVTLETTSDVPPSGGAGKVIGPTYLAVNLTAVNSTDATIDMAVWGNVPVLADAAGRELPGSHGFSGRGTVNVRGGPVTTQSSGPEGLRPDGSLAVNARYDITGRKGPYTLTWVLSPERVVQFRID